MSIGDIAPEFLCQLGGGRKEEGRKEGGREGGRRKGGGRSGQEEEGRGWNRIMSHLIMGCVKVSVLIPIQTMWQQILRGCGRQGCKC